MRTQICHQDRLTHALKNVNIPRSLARKILSQVFHPDLLAGANHEVENTTLAGSGLTSVLLIEVDSDAMLAIGDRLDAPVRAC